MAHQSPRARRCGPPAGLLGSGSWQCCTADTAAQLPDHTARETPPSPGTRPAGTGPPDVSRPTPRSAGRERADPRQRREVSLWCAPEASPCLLYTSDAADDLLCVDLGGRRIIKKKKKK